MKKQLSLFIWAVAMFGMSSVMAAGNSGMSGASSADLTGAPGVRPRANVNYEKYETRSTKTTYVAKDAKNIYYTQPARRSEIYKDYDGQSSRTATRTTRGETARNVAKRKYYLAHPFFQPLENNFGSVTDLSYESNSYNLTANNLLLSADQSTITGETSVWKSSGIAVREDLSFGITDSLAVVGSLRYKKSDYEFSSDETETPLGYAISQKDSGIDIWSLGLQWRFVDDADWIATLSGYYQNQMNTANSFTADLKAGYKLGKSTIYGLARVWQINLAGASYGNEVKNPSNKESVFVAYNVNDKNVGYLEGGVGLFSVLDEDWTLNLEVILGSYEWHSQAAVKAAIGWQPYESFALNLYGKTAVYDSANSKDLGIYLLTAGTLHDAAPNYTAKLDSFAEYSIGLQAILYF